MLTFARLAAVLLAIFSAAAEAADAPKRPLVFVPGILGSRLCNGDEVVWGKGNSLRNFRRLELGVSNPELKPCGIVDEIQILGSWWTHNTYKSWLATLQTIGYEEDKNLFVFAYDWRLSNAANAKKLGEFIREKIPSGTKFDILAHSMGGIVSRLYLSDQASATDVQQIIYLGTPFLGSMDVFGTIKEGWGWPMTELAGGQEVVTRVAISFPGMIELLPRYDGCCYIRRADNSRIDLDVFDPEQWKKLNWLPSLYLSDATAFARFSKALNDAKNMTPILKKPAPSGIYETIYASDIHDTLRLLGMRENATKPQDWIFTSSKGDGTVPVWSVARSMNSEGYSNTAPSFSKHEHLFDDKWVINAATRLLVAQRPNEPFQVDAPGRPLIEAKINGVSTAWQVNLAKTSLTQGLYRPNESVIAELTIDLIDTASDLASGAYKPAASLTIRDNVSPLAVREVTTPDDLQLKRLRFVASGLVGGDEGVGVVSFQLTDGLESSQAFYVARANN